MTKKKKILIMLSVIIFMIMGIILYYISQGPKIYKTESLNETIKTNQNEQILQKEIGKIIRENAKIEEWATNLYVPWGLVFIDDEIALVTERNGNIRLIKNGILQNEPYLIIETDESGEGGLMGIDKDPDFPNSPYIYVMHTTKTDNRISKIHHNGNTGIYEKAILTNLDKGKYHNGGRIKFGPDGYLYITTGEQFNAERSQNLKSLSGKILRIDKNGNIPKDNPFQNEIYSYGHRNAQGLAWNEKGVMFSSEHGPSGEFGIFNNDEINKIIKGGNYGWPKVVGKAKKNEYIDPIVVWQDNAVPPGGMDFLNKKLFVATLRSWALIVIEFDENENVLGIERWFSENDIETFGRLRDVVARNGALYITTSNKDGRGTPNINDDKILKITFK